MLIGIDTSVIVGLLDIRDIWHSQAVGLQKAIARSGFEPIYFDCALAEATSTIARRLREKGREAELNELLNHLLADYPVNTITWILPDAPRLYQDVIDLIRSSGGQLNFNDALIALTCRERGIASLASFDSDFDKLAWLKRLSRAEDVERPR